MRHVLAASSLALALLTSPVAAITVGEADVGDFDTTNNFLLVSKSIGTLDIGGNTISGSITSDCAFSGPDLQCTFGPDATDAFLLTIAPGQILTSVMLETLGTAPTGFQPSFGMVDTNGFTFVHNDSLATFNSTVPIIDGVPISAGTYVFGVGQGLASATGAANYGWTLSMTVALAPVPLPAGAPLLFGGIAALAVGRRLRKGQTAR